MAFNGSGTFSRTNGTNSGNTTWQLDAAAGTKILSTRHDTHDQDIADGLTNCVCKDGQTTPTANLPMGGFGHTNVAAATARTMYARASQIQDGALLWGGTSGGAGNAYTISLSPAITAYAAGMRVAFLSDKTNTGAATLDINSVGATAIKLVATALEAGRIISGQIIEVKYDGTNFQLLNTTPVSGGIEVVSTGGFQRSALTGDVTASAGSNATTIANSAVTTAKIASGAVTAAKLTIDGDVSPDTDGTRTLGDGSHHFKLVCMNRPAYKNVWSVTAAGTTQGTATALSGFYHRITSGTAGVADGVILPTPTQDGELLYTQNQTAGAIKIYPHSGGTIEGLAANAAYSQASGNFVAFLYDGAAAVWRYTQGI